MVDCEQSAVTKHLEFITYVNEAFVKIIIEMLGTCVENPATIRVGDVNILIHEWSRLQWVLNNCFHT